MRPLLAGVALAGLATWYCTPAAAETSARRPLNTIREVFAAIEACYRPPPLDRALPGMQITFQLSFRRDGSILGEPQITYETSGASEDQRYAYRLAVAQALQRCTPLPFSESLGSAVAGRPFNMRIIDTRRRERI
jgi:hypothetical protein